MRTVEKTLTVTNTVTENKIVVSEKIAKCIEDKISRHIEVHVYQYDSNEELLNIEHYHIVGENYDLLMSESPDFAQGKPKNEYREQDLWFVIDNLLLAN